jgi:hypothetical protein
MIRIFTIVLIACFTNSCAPSGSQSNETTRETAERETPAEAPYEAPYGWTRLTSNPGYSKTYNYQMFAQGDKLYVFHPDGVQESSDGVNWTKTGLKNILTNQTFMDYVQYRDAVYALGTFSGSLSQFEMTSQIARTTDFKNWEILAKKSNLPRRCLYHPVVFQNKIWIFGGNDGITVYADAWTSTDGVNWQKVADDLPFGARHSQYFVVFKNLLYMIQHDVWVSKDGLEWTPLAQSFSATANVGYTPVVFDDKLWLIGSSQGGKLGSQILYTENGLNWQPLQAPWSPRGLVAAAVFKDQLFITGGKYGGTDDLGADLNYVNDVWAMKKK